MMERFADIEGPVWIGLLTPLLLIGAAVLLLALLAVLVYRRRRAGNQRAFGPVVPLRSPLEVAVERLERLKQADLDLDSEPFTVEVADIVRDYLEAALRIPAREQTSEEFLQALQQGARLPEVLHAHMPRFLEQCDRVKFARQLLEIRQRTVLLETAGTVVLETDRSLQPAPTTEQPSPQPS